MRVAVFGSFCDLLYVTHSDDQSLMWLQSSAVTWAFIMQA